MTPPRKPRPPADLLRLAEAAQAPLGWAPKPKPEPKKGGEG